MMKNKEVTIFLDELIHPFRVEIELLRDLILGSNPLITENIKWNGPNYSVSNEDRITMRINPPKQVQLVFHCGAKTKQNPSQKIIQNDFGILVWRSNDRAIATFKNLESIENSKEDLILLISEWIKNAK
jgi:hypothetical protein